MEMKPTSGPDGAQYASCPYCTLRIKVGDVECPHCRKPLPPHAAEGGKAAVRRPLSAVGRPRSQGFWDRHGKWVKAAAPIVLALVVLAVVYQRWVGVRITVSPNPSLPVKATVEKEGNTVLLRGTVTNDGDDVPDLSMKSIGVMVDFSYRDGRRYRKRIFPKTEYRGEGALLRGETGDFEVEAPKAGLEEIVLRADVVDLAGARDLVPPGGKWRVDPEGR